MAAETETHAQTTETTVELPETTDVAGAVDLMGRAGLGDDTIAPAARPDTSNAQEEGADTVETEQEAAEAETETEVEQETETQETETTADGAPEFWSAEDKAAWQKVPLELRPTIAKYEQQRIAFVNEKTREAAQLREEAMRVAQGAVGVVEQAAAWWQQNGPEFEQVFADKWSQVDWNKLAADNPAEWTRLKQQRDHEATLLIEANRRGQADIAIANERAKRAFLETRQAEHAKLATKLPEYFGPDVAAKTYGELGDFLFAKGIPIDRINTIHEAPIIELALAAMRFEQAQKQASTVRASSSSGAATANSTAKTTPTRVAPGPAPNALGRAGNRQGEAARQVGERFRKSGGASIADAAELIRLNEL